MTTRLVAAGLLLFCGISQVIAGRTGAAALAVAPSHQGYAAQNLKLVQQLDAFAGQYWARVAGRDTGLPPRINGHDEFLAQWTRQILASLHGLPVGVVRQSFKTPGFRSLPAKRPGVNVIVVVPGTRHPDQAVVLGAHPDGEPTSKGSAFDDTSGCMILLGLAQVLGDDWRKHGLPSLTVEFVLFDAEEQGLVGSAAFGFAYLHGAAMPRPVFMINEEQSGVGYPVRPFGLRSESLLPSFAVTTGRLPARVSGILGTPRRPDQAALNLALQRLNAARSPVFAQLRRAYPTIQYRGGSSASFTQADEQYLQIGPMPLCCSDNAPFEALGLPTVTFAGNSDYYARDAQPWSFPYDQPEDTPTALACDTDGAPQPGTVLEAALELPLQLSIALVHDYAPPVAHLSAGLTVFSTLPAAGAPAQFQAVGARQVTWDFGDGKRGVGSKASHTFRRAGTYSLTVHGDRQIGHFRIKVAGHASVYVSSFTAHPPPRRPWRPAALQDIPGCH